MKAALENLSFGTFQLAVLISFLVISVLFVAIFALAASKSRERMSYEEVSETLYGLRRSWLVVLATVLGIGLVLSLSFTPFGKSEGPVPKVDVTAYQFGWKVKSEDAKIKAGDEVHFAVTSADVNHGLGIYDPDGVMIGNVQAMPEYTNNLYIKLDKPGTYQFGCLEYCGLLHHDMVEEFEVIP